MIDSLHQGRPTADVVLLVDVAASLHELLDDVESPGNCGKHEGSGPVVWLGRVPLADVLVENFSNPHEVA